MSKDDMQKYLSKLDRQVRIMDGKISRIETKLNHILEIIETFFEEDEENNEDFDSDETWVPDPESWLNNEDDEEEI